MIDEGDEREAKSKEKEGGFEGGGFAKVANSTGDDEGLGEDSHKTNVAEEKADLLGSPGEGVLSPEGKDALETRET